MTDGHDPSLEQIAPVPRISMQAFCETTEMAQVIQAAIDDRRMEKAHVKLHMGGPAAAIEAYRSAPTPNVIFLEATAKREELVQYLTALAEFCDAGTKVVVTGRMNDIVLYRDLMARGVSEYLVAPFTVLDFIRAISKLYTSHGADPVGKVVAFVGAKAASAPRHSRTTLPGRFRAILKSRQPLSISILASAPPGLTSIWTPRKASPRRSLRRTASIPTSSTGYCPRCGDKLGLLAAPATLDRMYDFPETAFDSIVDILRASTPCVILDIPHGWTAWMRRMIVGADEVVLVAAPDLANLRNTKSLLDTIRAARPHDAKPKLVLNFVGVPKRPEIAAADFAKAVDLEPTGIINFEPKLFGTGANNGQMIAEVEPTSKASETILDLARAVTGRPDMRKAKKNLFEPFK